MKKLMLILVLTLNCFGCAHVPPLFDWAKTGRTKTWTVHPDDRARFDLDYARCTNVAQTFRHFETARDRCLTQIGYTLEVTTN